MSIWRNIADAIVRGIGSEVRYRREHPCETAREFRGREKFWEQQGRPVLRNIARRRAERWAARCRDAGGEC